MVTIEQLQAELALLRDEVRQLRSVHAVQSAEPRLLSRRNLLRAGPVAGLGMAIAAASTTPAAASAGQSLLLGQANTDSGGTTSLTGGTPQADQYYDGGVPAGSPAALAVKGGLTTDWFVATDMTMGVASQDAGVLINPSEHRLALHVIANGYSQTHFDIGSECALFEGADGATVITVKARDGHGYSASADPNPIVPGDGVTVSTGVGVAFVGQSSGQVVQASSTDASSTVDAVTIAYAGRSRALYAESHNATNINGTITGVNDGHGIGLWGEQRNDTGTGFGVVGVAGKLGRGAQFTGGAAAVRMVPSTATTHPTSGRDGDFFVDSSARLWYCQKASTSSVVATWRQLA
jgi:hypothetical protein